MESSKLVIIGGLAGVAIVANFTVLKRIQNKLADLEKVIKNRFPQTVDDEALKSALEKFQLYRDYLDVNVNEVCLLSLF
ncbi:hypothetical protein A2U01_0000981 [Trifolium medium]|uniref:Uncharacterized protein n=1 Tax=Trifolium medium TaxID=97028 RepID=A0A392LZ00_9FABA|nr:hypothetical protein [Trifolium medium]